MGRFMEVALLLVSLGIVDGSATPTTQIPASTAAGATTLPTPVSTNTRTGGQEYPEGVSYLLVYIQHLWPASYSLAVAAGETGGSFLVDYPQLGYNDTGTVTPYGSTSAYIDSSLGVTVGVENKAFIIHVFGKDMGVYGHTANYIFSALPISALGSRYVVSTCLGNQTQVVLVIANHNHKTDVDITLMLDGNVTYDNMTYNNGDMIHMTLDEYQTFTMKSDYDLTGTVINTTNTVAVFSGTMQDDYFTAVTQLLPVRHHGMEYVMYTGDYSSRRNATYQLQVISDQSNTEIMLNNGSTFSLGDNRVYRQYLAYNESLYLKATRPVMATLCRNSTFAYRPGIVVVVPVTYFVNSALIPYTACINILTKQHVTDIEVLTGNMVPATLDWVDIPGSDYKAGRNCSLRRYYVRSASRFAVYGFFYGIFNGGYHFPSDPPTTGADAGSATPTTQTPASTAAGTTTLPTPVSNNTQTGGQEYADGVSYLLASFQYQHYTDAVAVAAGETGGSFLVDYPQLGYNVTRTVTPYGQTYAYIDSSLWVTVGVENKAYVIHVFGKNMGVHRQIGNYVLSPLPISALGSRYVVSTCLGDMGHVVLVIANHNHKTDVDITLMLEGNVTYDNMTYNDGDTIHVTLDEYQTFTMKNDYDLTGTVINATHTVAVFSRAMQSDLFTTVTQLLPVRHHGTEYVMYTGDNSGYRNSTYQLQVISDQSNTEIMLNNGSTFSLGDNRVYRQYLASKESLYLNATKPVMATLCRNSPGAYLYGFAVVVPVTFFVKSALIPYTNSINILTKQHVTDIEVFIHDMVPVTLDWVDIPGSEYKAGRNCSYGTYIVRSASRFAAYGFNIDNGGYRFPTDPPTTGADAGSATPTTQTTASTAAGVTTLPTPVSTNTRTGGQEYAEGSATPTTQTLVSTTAGATTLPTPASTNTRTGGQEYAEGVSYLLASFQYQHYTDVVAVAAGETGGSFLVDYPQLGYNDTRTVTPHGITYANIDPSLLVTVGVENKAYVIHVFGKNMGVHTYMGNGFFSPLPISALGSRYVVSTCLGDMGHVVLVIANHNHKTDVDITLMLEGNVTYDNMTYNDGDTIHVTLDEYQTFTMKSDYDLTGTVINTTNTVAVFSGAMQGDYFTAVTQLLPVRHHGTEYVLYTGDDSYYRNATYQLQVISDQSDAEIMLNNGSTFSLGDNRVYRQYLAYNESLYLNATRPVMATLCRNGTDVSQHGFVVVVPVTYFVNSALIPDTECINILTKQHVMDIEVFTGDMAPATLDWVDIPGSDYKAGRSCSFGIYIIRSASRFAVYGFSWDIVNGGYRFPSDPPTTGADAGSATPTTQTPASTTAGATTLPTPVSTNTRTGGQEYPEGVSYLLASFQYQHYTDVVAVAAGETGGSFLVDYPQLGYNDTRTVTPHGITYANIDPSLLVTVGVENKAYVIHVFGKNMGVHTYMGNGFFSPLPISALGSRYVVSTCLGDMGHVVLVIANHNHKTDVDITLMLEGNVTYDNMTYNDGDTIHVTLDEYQTFTMKSDYDLTGTVINTTNTVAVFSGAMQGDYFTAATQLLPVRHHGTEYVMYTGDHSYFRNATYQLQVISDQSDAEIMLNIGSTFSLGDNRVYRQYLAYNESLYLTATRPVMATLCRNSTDVYRHGFVVVVPVTYFVNSALIPDTECINILTKQHVTDIEVFTVDMVPVALDWVDIPGSDYKAGRNSSYGRYIVRSASRFAVYGFSRDIVNGGYRFSSDPPTTGADAGSATPTTQTPASTAAGATTLPTPVSNNTRTGGQEYPEGVGYLLVYIQYNAPFDYAVTVAAGETGGSFLVDYPQLGYNVTRTVTPYGFTLVDVNGSLRMTVGVENKAFIIHVFGEDMGVHGHCGYDIFSPLPISALGSRYVVSICLGYKGQVVLVIASHNHKTDVDITLMLEGNVTYDNMTYNNGDTIHVTLDEYQTFTMKSDYDLTGTVINATNTVAVFSGEMQGDLFTAVTQLLHVRHHGTEYVMYTCDVFNHRNWTYQLQVISDQSNTEIMLNNGSTFSLDDNRVYRQYLAKNESLYLNATRPVMATLCRNDPHYYDHGIVVVVPVTYFVNSAFIPYTKCINILTKQYVSDIEVFTGDMVPVTLDWVDIPGSDYKAGRNCSFFSYFVRSASRFAVYGFSIDIVNGGYNFPTNPSTTGADAGSTTPMTQSPASTPAGVSTLPTPVSSNSGTGGQDYAEGVSYLLVFFQDQLFLGYGVTVAAGETGGSVLIDYPQQGYNDTRTVKPYRYTNVRVDHSLAVSVGVETKAFVVYVFGKDMSVYGDMGNAAFSLLPISALGSRYVVSACLGYLTQAVLVIANHKHKTDVDITLMLEGNATYDNMTYNGGDTIHVTLDEYQTFTMKSDYDLTGTVINATNTVAVFYGAMQNSFIHTLAQLLPVRHHGTEYVLHAGDHSNPGMKYQLQVISDQSNTAIMLNNGSTISLDENRVYRQYIAYNDSLYFNATRPVMATLCTDERFAVVAPVPYFVDSALFPFRGCINILTKQHVTDIEVFSMSIYPVKMSPATLDWVDISGSDYKAGIVCSGDGYLIRSASRFAAYVFGYDIVNEGYRFPTEPPSTGADAECTGVAAKVI
ncbi:uncharacterized protein LOC124120969 [Haliotis rufescens]|uniref:uncharacterized protein LOC124120969 n=1 Tax=Haliotis rufescens TaxID=6454 RepID=UPI00201ECFE5|nr:uncharacterized protein LOC124120969 [Haliotis rufescens]